MLYPYISHCFGTFDAYKEGNHKTVKDILKIPDSITSYQRIVASSFISFTGCSAQNLTIYMLMMVTNFQYLHILFKENQIRIQRLWCQVLTTIFVLIEYFLHIVECCIKIWQFLTYFPAVNCSNCKVGSQRQIEIRNLKNSSTIFGKGGNNFRNKTIYGEWGSQPDADRKDI